VLFLKDLHRPKIVHFLRAFLKRNGHRGRHGRAKDVPEIGCQIGKGIWERRDRRKAADAGVSS